MVTFSPMDCCFSEFASTIKIQLHVLV